MVKLLPDTSFRFPDFIEDLQFLLAFPGDWQQVPGALKPVT
jgi:hypothetical protein